MDEVLVFETLLKHAMYMTRRIAIVSSMIPTAPIISICMSMSIKYFFWVKRKTMSNSRVIQRLTFDWTYSIFPTECSKWQITEVAYFAIVKVPLECLITLH